MKNPGKVFRALHEKDGAFVIPNPWDIGSARILAGMGFKALATTSGGMAYALGKPDGGVSKEQTLKHCRDIVSATPLPVSADLEKGFGDSPESVFKTITAAAETGLAGCSIEDYTGNPQAPIFEKTLAVERIEAASEACRSLTEDFVLTARCEKLVWGETSLDDVIERLLAFEAAGADVLFAPGLDEFSAIKQVCSAISKPVNIIMSTPDLGFGLEDLINVGAKRISVGSSLAQLAYGSLVNAAREMAENSSFSFTNKAIDYIELEAFFNHEGDQ